MCKYSFNPYYRPEPRWEGPEFAYLAEEDALDFHRSLAGYRPTPLVKLTHLAKKLGVAEIFVKDEAHRYGVKAFKPLGAGYAIFRLLKQKWREKFAGELTPADFSDPGKIEKLGTFTFCAATDGNHGRAVAWTARKLGQKAVIYMPADAARGRVESIRGEGAEVVLVPGTYDDCVTRCAGDAQKEGWQVVSDTTFPGYTEIPKYIMLGYRTLFYEMENDLHSPGKAGVDLVVLPAGVGGLAAAGAGYYTRRYGANRPKMVCIEPEDSDCYLESIRFGNGRPLPTRGKLESMMVGLACGIPSAAAWPVIRDSMDCFLAVPDRFALSAMREYHEQGIVSGESGCAGLAALLALVREPGLREAASRLGIGPGTRILLINTEGDTAPGKYREIIAGTGGRT